MQTTANPFQEISERLHRIENALIDLKETKTSFTDPEDEIPISIQKAAEIIGLAVPSIYGLVHRGTIPHMKKNKRLYFYKRDLIAWIQSGRKMTNDEIRQAAAESLRR
jgi:predicted DNA-binding transcriptional regulator AlpA